MSAELRVRPGRPEDIDALRAIRLEALGDAPDAFGDTLELASRWSEELWREKASSWNYYLAEVDGRVVGMASGASNDQHPGTSWLFAMYVTPAQRGTGVAVALVDRVSTWAVARGTDALYLYVAHAVPRARAFYLKAGFVPTGTTITMHRDESLVLDEMRRDLSGVSFHVEPVSPETLYDLRRRVLRRNDPAAEVANPGDAAASTRHYGGFVGDRVVVSATFLEGPAPFAPDEAAYQLRYMATDFDVQGRGLGSRTLQWALEDLARQGVARVWANARVSALDFYVIEEWQIVPESFFVSAESGVEHVVIHRDLPRPAGRR